MGISNSKKQHSILINKNSRAENNYKELLKFDPVENYLSEKIEFVHKNIFRKYISDVRDNNVSKKDCEKSFEKIILYLNDSKVYVALDKITREIITSNLAILLYRCCEAGNCLAFRSALLKEILLCENNHILENFHIGHLRFPTENKYLNYAFLILVDARTGELLYVVEPTFKKILKLTDELHAQIGEVVHFVEPTNVKRPGSVKLTDCRPVCDFLRETFTPLMKDFIEKTVEDFPIRKQFAFIRACVLCMVRGRGGGAHWFKKYFGIDFHNVQIEMEIYDCHLPLALNDEKEESVKFLMDECFHEILKFDVSNSFKNKFKTVYEEYLGQTK